MSARKTRSFACVFLVIFPLVILGACASHPAGNSVVQISPSSAVLSPGQAFQFKVVTDVPNLSSEFLWEVNGVLGGSASIGTITTEGLYTAPVTPPAQPVQIGIREQAVLAMVTIFDPGHPFPGSVTSTQNPLVASYSITIPAGASVSVQFGPTTSYGLSTSSVSVPAGGSPNVLVAGMVANATYHMQAVVQLPDGSQLIDSDHTFQTGAIPAAILPNLTTELTGAGTPSPGVELLSLVVGATQNVLSAVATDLGGNVIWYYDLPAGAFPEPIKLLPNGHMLLVTDGSVNDIREVDLAGNIIHQITSQQVISSIASVPSFASAVWAGFNHDVLVLPNGHMILLASINETINNQPGIPSGTIVLGNALIDWDLQQNAPAWTWSTFDHFDLSYAPNGLADWTHGNAVIYSPDDGDLIFSMRNLNWVVKINYADGTGDGSIRWRLGPNGDFTLPSGQAPIKWNYGQHYPTIQSPNSSGVFSLMVFNNGNNRLVDANNDVCGSPGATACYSSVPIYQLDESQKTATVLWEDNLSPAYSICCGDAVVLPNGDVEFDVAADVNSQGISYIEEVTQTQPPVLIWRMNVQGQLAYRGFRIPSLYPGQVWPANALQVVHTVANQNETRRPPNR